MVRTFSWKGKKYYYLGILDGEPAYLEESKFDCEWYWSIGYIEGFTNKRHPERSADISYHTHFEYLMSRNRNQNWFDAFKSTFVSTPLTDQEIWMVVELMKSLYTARRYSDMLHLGGSNYTTNPAKEKIMGGTEYKRINEVVIPAMLSELYKILGGASDSKEVKRNGKAS